MEGTVYELKYCERCGTLGLRRSRSAESYCRPCGQVLVSYSLPGDNGRRRLLPKSKAEPLLPLVLKGTVQTIPSGRRPQ
jgi:hypothetical protein